MRVPYYDTDGEAVSPLLCCLVSREVADFLLLDGASFNIFRYTVIEILQMMLILCMLLFYSFMSEQLSGPVGLLVVFILLNLGHML